MGHWLAHEEVLVSLAMQVCQQPSGAGLHAAICAMPPPVLPPLEDEPVEPPLLPVEQTQESKVPEALQSCAPALPSAQVQAELWPGVHFADGLSPHAMRPRPSAAQMQKAMRDRIMRAG